MCIHKLISYLTNGLVEGTALRHLKHTRDNLLGKFLIH